MNFTGKLFSFLIALVIGAAAGPALAQKTYYISGMPTSAPVGGTVSADVSVFNNSPDGNSNYNSFKLIAPAGVKIEAVSNADSTYAGSISSPAQDPSNSNRWFITVTNINPAVGKNSAFVVNLTLSGSCGGGGQWDAMVRGGSQLNGQVFNTSTLYPLPTTAVSSPTCNVLSFQVEPKNAIVGTTITGTDWNPAATNTVKVKATQNGVNAANVVVTLAQATCAPGTLSLSGATATTGTDGVATFTTLSSSAAAKDCKLAASASGYTSGSMAGMFTVSTPTLAFVYDPNNALSGVTITNTPFNSPPGKFVTAQLLIDGAAPPSGFPSTAVTVTSSCTVIGGNTESTNASGIAEFDALKITNTVAQSACTLTANALGVQKSSTSTFNIAPFTPEGKLDCGETADPSFVTFPASLPDTEPGFVMLERGPYNTKGDTPCVEVDFEFTNKIVITGGEDTVILKWDTVTQPNAAFRTTINWSAQMLPSEGYPTVRRPSLAWEFDGNGEPIVAKITEGLACLSPYLPAPYGKLADTLDADNADNTATINLTAVSPDVYLAMPEGIALPVYIGTERMLATRTGTSLALARAQAGTMLGAHSIGAFVMSTPMPVDMRSASPYNGKAVRMCVQSHGWTAYGGGMYFEKSQVIDTGDGWISVR